MLLTRRERKVMYCTGRAYGLKRECDKGLKAVDLMEKVESAIDALIQVFDDEEIAEQLSSIDEDFYVGEMR